MVRTTEYDAVIVGSGPNGLSAGATLAHAGLSVLLVEGKDTLGGSCRTAELTLPGFRHDVCAATHPMGVLSPVFRALELEKHGLEWAQAKLPLAHVLDDRAVLLQPSAQETAAQLGPDSAAWLRLVGPFVNRSKVLFNEIFCPIRIPSAPFLMARFGWKALRSCRWIVNHLESVSARALFTGCAAHSVMPLDAAGTASFGLVLAVAGHTLGWPCARGGSGEIVRALERCFRAAGGEVRTGQMVRSLSDLPDSRAIVFDLTPKQIIEIAEEELPTRYVDALKRFRYGGGTFKIDWALAGRYRGQIRPAAVLPRCTWAGSRRRSWNRSIK